MIFIRCLQLIEQLTLLLICPDRHVISLKNENINCKTIALPVLTFFSHLKCITLVFGQGVDRRREKKREEFAGDEVEGMDGENREGIRRCQRGGVGVEEKIEGERSKGKRYSVKEVKP